MTDTHEAAERLRKRLNSWWGRTPSIGTYCKVCYGSCHYDLGIDDVPHRDGCTYQQDLADLDLIATKLANMKGR